MTYPELSRATALRRRCCLVVGAMLTTALGSPVIHAQSSNQADAIRKNRMGTLVIETKPGATVRVEQKRHEFWFGAAISNKAFDGTMSAADAKRYREVFLQNFNSAVTENALKWLTMEPKQGAVNYAVVNDILKWTKAHQLPLRGHNIFWGIPKFVPDWLKGLDDASLRKVLEARARDIGRRYRGKFAEYDLNNEMIHGNYYADRLGQGITLDMAKWVRAEDPAALLYLNDYDILTGRRLDDYVAHIRALLDAGVPIAGIGVQGHLHGDTFDANALQHALDELAKFNLPIRITEFNFPGQRSKFYIDPKLAITEAEEVPKAQAIVDYYRICFAHPAVTGILMWGFWEGANWIPASSLYHLDWTPTPAGVAYRDLIFKEWWTHWEGTADQAGRCEVPAFFGQHVVTVGKQQKTVDLLKASGSATVKFR